MLNGVKRHLMRDRDASYGVAVKRRLDAMSIRAGCTANALAERIRRPNDNQTPGAAPWV